MTAIVPYLILGTFFKETHDILIKISAVINQMRNIYVRSIVTTTYIPIVDKVTLKVYFLWENGE